MSQADRLELDSMFQLKGSMLAITVLELEHNDLKSLDTQLTAKVGQAPQFFSNTPVVVALDKLPETESDLDLDQLMTLCRRHGLHPLAIRATQRAHIAAASKLDLPVLPPSGARTRQIDPSAREQSPPVGPVHRPTRIITTPVRGGQQVYAPGGDLIVMAAVSPGAELLADGNIHVYAPLRGRALAGIKGDTGARIFCQQLAAELLSIAGQYKVAEDLRREPLWGEATQISLSGQMLNITRL